MKFVKNFIDWFQKKPELRKAKRRPFFQEREVRMCHFGGSIGFELDGKQTECLRSIILFKKLSKNTLLGTNAKQS